LKLLNSIYIGVKHEDVKTVTCATFGLTSIVESVRVPCKASATIN